MFYKINQNRRNIANLEKQFKEYRKNAILYCDSSIDKIHNEMEKIGNELQRIERKFDGEFRQQKTWNTVVDEIMSEFEADIKSNKNKLNTICLEFHGFKIESHSQYERLTANDTNMQNQLLVQKEKCDLSMKEMVALEKDVRALQSLTPENGGVILLGFYKYSGCINWSPIYVYGSSLTDCININDDGNITQIIWIFDNLMLLPDVNTVWLEYFLTPRIPQGTVFHNVKVYLKNQIIFDSEMGTRHTSVLSDIDNFISFNSSYKEIEIAKITGHEKYMPLLEYIRSIGKTPLINGRPFVW